MKKASSIIIAAIIILAAVAIDRYPVITNITSCANANNTTKQKQGNNFDINPQNLLKVKHPHNNSQLIQYSEFQLLFNPDNKTPDFVAWQLLGKNTTGQHKRYNKFWKDDNVKNCPESSDYTHSGYDRGHLCPAADMKWSATGMKECFSMANMAPQNHSLNSGAWATLEEKCRTWAKRDSALIIIAGPIYDKNFNKTIGNAQIKVPSAFFKVILAPYTQNPRAIGFIYPNSPSPGNMKNYAMSVDNVEEITGLDFFFSLPDNIENEIEAKFSFNDWNNNQYH